MIKIGSSNCRGPGFPEQELMGLGHPDEPDGAERDEPGRAAPQCPLAEQRHRERQTLITKNGAAFQGQPVARHGAAGLTGPNFTSPALLVSAGDVFELSVWHSADAALNVEANSQTWFAIEVME